MKVGQIEAKEASLANDQHNQDLVSLIELTRSLASRDDIFEILFSVVSRLAEILNVDRGSIVLRETETDLGIVVASSDDASMRNHKFPLNKYPEIRQVLDSGQLLIIRDVTESPLLREVLRVEGSLTFSSMALIPIIGEDGPIAVLCLKSGARVEFSDYDLMHAQAVANATAIALNNARTLKRLRDESQALFSAHTRDKMKLQELSRYLDIFDSSRDAMLVMNEEGKLLFANPMAARLSRRPRSALVGACLRDLVDTNSLGQVEEVLADFKRGVFPAGIDFNLSKPAPETIVSVNFSRIFGEGDAVLATMRNVTSERGMAHELAQTKEFLERVIESSVDGIVSANLRGKVLVYNRAAEKFFGYPKSEVLNRMNVRQFYGEGVAVDIMRRIRLEDHGGTGRLEGCRVKMVTRDGAHVPVNLSASLVLGGKRVIGTVGIFTDIREKLAMESRLAEAQEQLQERSRQAAVAELAGAAAHELNQPLTSVMGYAEFLRRSVQEDPALDHAIDVILSETERMAEIVRKVGRVTRYETMSYVGGAKIMDLDRSSEEEADSSSEE